MPSSVVFTGPLGPGRTVTSKSFTNVRGANWDFEKDTLEVLQDAGVTVQLDTAATTTVTHTISGGNHTLTVTQ